MDLTLIVGLLAIVSCVFALPPVQDVDQFVLSQQKLYPAMAKITVYQYDGCFGNELQEIVIFPEQCTLFQQQNYGAFCDEFGDFILTRGPGEKCDAKLNYFRQGDDSCLKVGRNGFKVENFECYKD
ncbi:hypothetical protein MIR68_001449 [Amoeboaphelidium protococcarum]|nr:hypothetical protein MIR68_001449 [Amoeboaphelidium protococcarum]